MNWHTTDLVIGELPLHVTLYLCFLDKAVACTYRHGICLELACNAVLKSSAESAMSAVQPSRLPNICNFMPAKLAGRCSTFTFSLKAYRVQLLLTARLLGTVMLVRCRQHATVVQRQGFHRMWYAAGMNFSFMGTSMRQQQCLCKGW